MKIKSKIDSVQYDRRHRQFIVKGWCIAKEEDYTLAAVVNGEKADCQTEWEDRRDVWQEYPESRNSAHTGFDLYIPAPKKLEYIEIYACGSGGEMKKIMSYSGSQLKKRTEEGISYFIDIKSIINGCMCIGGWAVAPDGNEVEIEVTDGQGPVSHKITRMVRTDISKNFRMKEAEKRYGFMIWLNQKEIDSFVLTLRAGEQKIELPMDRKRILRELAVRNTKIFKTLRYLKHNGLRRTVDKVYGKVLRKEDQLYQRWYLAARPSAEELEAQRKQKFEKEPLISILVPLYRTPEKFLKEMIASVQGQTYGNWELCLADGSGEAGSLEKILAPVCQGDKRIRYRKLKENLGLSGNTNQALSMAEGEFVGLLDHDDLLAPNALYEIVRALNEKPDTDIFYTDEDKIDQSGRKHFAPNLKPDYNMDLLRSMNYICHFFCVRRSLAEAAGGFHSGYDGAQDYDFILRCIEQSEKICHVAKILYHWRAHQASTAKDPDSKQYAFEAGIRVLEDHYRRIGVSAEVSYGRHQGLYRTVYEMREKPLLSVLIPSKDHSEDLDKCIRSLLEKSDYRNIEIIVVENNSTEDKTFEYYETVQKRYPQVKVAVWDKGRKFNYSALNNYGASLARGEYLLLLNNDTEMIRPDSISEMIRVAQRPEVGIVGARLLYEDNTLQHAGVVVGLGGVAGHIFWDLPADERGYMDRPSCMQDLSAVTAACLMVRRSIFDEVGGLTEALAVAFNDIDFCLKVRKAGYLVVYDPYAELYHYESKSRGKEDTPDKIARYMDEVELFRERWKDFLRAGDPYYNPNLTLEKTDYSLRDFVREP